MKEFIKLIIKTNLFFSFFILSLLASFSVYAAEIQVKVDRGSIQLNETFTLTFESSESVDDDPDFSPLKKDFQILNQSTSSNISLINGKYTKSMRWNIALMALKEGTLTIPAISFGSDKSPAVQLAIKPVQKSTGKSGEEFMSEVDINVSTAFPQSQIIITQRLLSSKNINGYEFSTLKTSGPETVIEPLGDIKQYQTKRGDSDYLVLEQSFAAYPQSAGTLIIEPSIATARLAIDNRSSYNSFGRNTKTVRRSSDKKVIKVTPVPTAFKGKHWLPAKEVQLVEEFPESATYTAGEPITRTLSLLADGQSASQLPEFIITEIKNLKQYPDKPILNDNKSDDGITGIQQIKVAIIPSAEGSYTLPAISIPWWNTKTNKLEIAKLPERIFNVGKAVSTTSQPPSINMAPLEPETQPVEPLNPQVPVISTTDTSNAFAWKLISLFLAIGWITSLLFLFRKKFTLTPTDRPPTDNVSLSHARKQLQNACENNDAAFCKDALLHWANALFLNQSFYSLGELSKRVTPDLATSINSLSACLYKNKSTQWQCENLFDLCSNFEETVVNNKTTTDNNSRLEDLYQ